MGCMDLHVHSHAFRVSWWRGISHAGVHGGNHMSFHRSSRRELFIAASLLVGMWLTRARWLVSDDHFGAGLSLPDASWALFFLSGLLTVRFLWPALLLASAITLDYLALRNGVSSYCVTPAYLFLVPTYLTLWGTGRWAAFDVGIGARAIARATVALIIGVVAAFLISNVSFYYLAGYFDRMPALVYADRVSRYLPHYLLTTAMYCGVAGLSAYVLRGWREVVRRGIGAEDPER